jgi:diguanylate cyclase (GGDEF)-like protein
MVARMGGEEFAVVLPGASAEAAENVCERFRLRLSSVDWEAVSPGLAVTASIGLAANGEGGTARSVLALADSRLYAAKSAGRNRVVGRSASPALVH